MLAAIMRNAGVKPARLLSVIPDWLRYRHDRRAFRVHPEADTIPWGKELPILGEWREPSGNLGAYFFQDQIAARWIFETSPRRHVDIGSRIDGFIGHLAVFRQVDVIDIRPQKQQVAGVRFHRMDLMSELPEQWVESTDSLSCLHTIEHFGLGRYGDPIDPGGHLKGLRQLFRLVEAGGQLILSTPVGTQRIEFNAHRVFAPGTMVSWFSEGWEIERSAVIDDANRSTETAGSAALEQATCETGVGMILARKK